MLARLSTLRMTRALAREMELAHQATAQRASSHDAASNEHANAELHDVICKATSNPFTIEQARTVRLRM